MHVALGLSFTNRAAPARLASIIERCSARLPGDIDKTPQVIRWDDRPAALLLWSNKRAIDQRAEQTERDGFAYTGYVTTQDASPADLLARITVRDGLPGFTESVGGSAAFFHICRDSDVIVAWASKPMVQGLYYGETDGVSVVSTRPRISAAALGEPIRNPQYAVAALAAGHSIGRETPFESVMAIESGEAAILKNGKATIRPYPVPQVSFVGSDPFRDELLHAVSAIGQQGENEFRLSGGKDSRLIAAAAYKLGLKVSAHTRGSDDQWGEIQVAKRVSAALGFQHRSGLDFHVDDLHGQMTETMLARDGVVYPEMFLSIVDTEAYPTSATSLTMGHSHLQRGGWVQTATKFSAPRPIAISCLQSPFVRAEFNLAQKPFVDTWFDNHESQAGIVIRNKLDSLLWCYEFFRVSKYLQSLRLFYDPYLTCVFPLLDERFARACGEMDPRERRREIGAFSATTAFAPALATIPLFGARYRFEMPGRHEGFEFGYEERDPDSVKPSRLSTVLSGDAKHVPVQRVFYADPRNGLIVKEAILSSRLWQEVRPLLTHEAALAIERLGSAGSWWDPPEGTKRRAFIKLSWLLFAQAIADEIEW